MWRKKKEVDVHVATDADAHVDVDVTVNDSDNDNDNTHRRRLQQLSDIWPYGHEWGPWPLVQKLNGLGKLLTENILINSGPQQCYVTCQLIQNRKTPCVQSFCCTLYLGFPSFDSHHSFHTPGPVHTFIQSSAENVTDHSVASPPQRHALRTVDLTIPPPTSHPFSECLVRSLNPFPRPTKVITQKIEHLNELAFQVVQLAGKCSANQFH